MQTDENEEVLTPEQAHDALRDLEKRHTALAVADLIKTGTDWEVFVTAWNDVWIKRTDPASGRQLGFWLEIKPALSAELHCMLEAGLPVGYNVQRV